MTNIIGLTLGLATCCAIFLWIIDELYFDKFHTKSNRIYKVMINDIYPNGKIDTYQAPTMKIGDALRADIPEVEELVQMSWETEMLVKNGEKNFNETGLYADSTLFSVFSFPVSNGNKKKPLPNQNAIAISEKLAQKFFKDQNPIGKILNLNHANNFIVSSVFKDIPSNSLLKFDFIISFELWKKENAWANHWRSGATQAFVTLNTNANFEATDTKVRKLIKKNCSDCNREAFLYQFSKLYLHNNFENGKNIGGRINQLVLFGLIAFIILAMACFNYTNLATARAATRNKEIGVRKSVGATRFSIGFQFMGESIFLAFLSLFFAVLLVNTSLPFLNEITGKTLALNFQQPILIGGTLLITAFCGILAGIYPAFYLSSLKVSAILKNDKNTVFRGVGIRKILVVSQFTVSIVLIIGSIVIYKQLGFILKKSLGFDKKNIVVLRQKEEFSKNYASFKNDLLQIPTVKNVAFVGNNLFQVPITTTDPIWAEKPANSSISFKILRCDEGFLPTMNIKLLSGRNFKNNDSSNYIINRKAMQAMGLTTKNVIGSKLEMWNGKGEIIGLTEDFINGNLHQNTEPLILMFTTSNGSYYYVKTIENANVNQTLARLETVSKKYAPDSPFEFSFLDKMYNNEYADESIQGKLSLVFTLLAVIICCLGL